MCTQYTNELHSTNVYTVYKGTTQYKCVHSIQISYTVQMCTQCTNKLHSTNKLQTLWRLGNRYKISHLLFLFKKILGKYGITYFESWNGSTTEIFSPQTGTYSMPGTSGSTAILTRYANSVRIAYSSTTILTRHPKSVRIAYSSTAILTRHPNSVRIAYSSTAILTRHPKSVRIAYSSTAILTRYANSVRIAYSSTAILTRYANNVRIAYSSTAILTRHPKVLG